MSTAGVVIDGDGVAALCCAHLLSQSGISFHLDSSKTGKQPAILLSTQAASLLQNVCQSGSVLDGGWRIERRVVLWGDAREPVYVAHAGIAISEELLIEEMHSRLRISAQSDSFADHWRIATRNAAPEAEVRTYGKRRAVSSRVTLKYPTDSRSCWVESTSMGWLFLLPFNEREASLISAGHDTAAVFEESRLIAPLLSEQISQSPAVSIAPRIAQSLCGDKLIVAGNAAMRFDPLCGEGAGHAVREAYLAIAVIRAALRGESVAALIHHYEGRLQQAFLRHLMICDSFYSTGGQSAFWSEENASLQEGIQELRSLVAAVIPPQFRFSGIDLEATVPHSTL